MKSSTSQANERLRIIIHGAVQGVGFRPNIYRIAKSAGVRGWVQNSNEGVVIEAEAEKTILQKFLFSVEKNIPPHSFIQNLEHTFLEPVGYTGFEIRKSDVNGTVNAIVLPDIATCPDCLGEIFDPANRRYRYPFTNCTHCGPRYSIIESLPYDRRNTTMKIFEMCDECRKEYEDPEDRRFHAQPNACPNCGPHLELWDKEGKVLASYDEALILAAKEIRNGAIAAVKGMGGFHLFADARYDSVIKRLRERKQREEKPLALMVKDLAAAEVYCEVSEHERHLLCSVESPIVLLHRRHPLYLNTDSWIADSVAPGNPYFGVELPYTPLHHLLMAELDIPVVATSGNISDEPICIDEHEALTRLQNIADIFLVHNRPIKRHIDDSVTRILAGREAVMRRARGYAPLPVSVARVGNNYSLLAVGAHQKNTIAVSSGDNVFISQHIGDLETRESCQSFTDTMGAFQELYDVHPEKIICDRHPDYFSSGYAHALGKDVVEIQHHHAHIVSCMAEHHLHGEVLGVAWDGTGYGLDGTIWGGEFLLADERSFRRVGTFHRFPLPGGDMAVKEPRRTALGLLYQLYGGSVFERNDLNLLQFFGEDEREILRQMLKNGVHSPQTSSVGRLFDAVASIIGLRQKISFEGQAAMELEFLTSESRTEEHYNYNITLGKLDDKQAHSSSHQEDASHYIVDWSPVIHELFNDLRHHTSASIISCKFHNTLADIIVKFAVDYSTQKRVILSGGCFQNKYLLEKTIHKLTNAGLQPFWHQRIPTNDGGISFGQIVAVRSQLNQAVSDDQGQDSDMMESQHAEEV